ncbi:MAG: endonuclease/exonuclease/phosphatase family protein [Kiritimatiellae bacterium]|nr:endonuclease/exonuclease/phosphatase family protein [Kiritimatiellia bacterium]
MKLPPRLLGVLIALLLLALASHAAPPAFHVANWNVENLYDTIDDPDNRFDDEFLPNNVTTRWTRARFETKLDNLARVIQAMNRGQGPDLLGLQEVENRYVLDELVKRLTGKPYGIVHYDSPDPRGIDVALLYNKDLFTLRHSKTHTVRLKWRRQTRDILQATLQDARGQLLHVLVNHWPSRGGGIEASNPDRFAAARVLKRAIDSLTDRDQAAHILVVGDFNDEPNSPSIRAVLDAPPYPSRSGYRPDKLYNLTAAKASQGWGTFFHSFRGRSDWRMYDQIIASGALLDNARIEFDDDSLWILQPAFMTESKGRRKGAPVPSFVSQEYYRGGYSDHFPIGARFDFLQPAPQKENPLPPPLAPLSDVNAPVLW